MIPGPNDREVVILGIFKRAAARLGDPDVTSLISSGYGSVFLWRMLVDSVLTEDEKRSLPALPIGMVLDWSAEGLPKGLFFDPLTGSIVGTPRAAGSYRAVTRVGEDTQTHNIEVYQ